jgi:regulator of protease activity HflC (stomatin/prohibitin superfamily)
MATTKNDQVSRERPMRAANGWVMLAVNIGIVALGPLVIINTLMAAGDANLMPPQMAFRVLLGVAVVALGVLMLSGHFTLQPNEGRVLILFGSYKGTVRTPGFHWANPLYARHRGKTASKTSGETTPKNVFSLNLGGTSTNLGGSGSVTLPTKLSLRAHNFNSETLKVNDNRGNPVEIGAVVVWRVADTAQAVFDVDDYESYVEVQSESALRHTASLYAYDNGEDDEITLRGGGDSIAAVLTAELQDRLDTAGILVEEARLTHFAYAPEIASAMLRRQQAEAVIAAREKIVIGAVSMVEMALRLLDEKSVVELDNERRAAMVSNLLVVLCGTDEATPVINTGTRYT